MSRIYWIMTALAQRPAVTKTLADLIEDQLPQTQCTKCGYPACRPYAEAIANGASVSDDAGAFCSRLCQCTPAAKASGPAPNDGRISREEFQGPPPRLQAC